MRVWGVSLLLALLGMLPNPERLDPASNLARVRIIVVTTAATTDVTVTGATIANALSTIAAGSLSARSSQTGQTLRLSRNVPGQAAEARFEMILAGVSSVGAIAWSVASSTAAELHLEIYSLNEIDRPRLVDRFTSDQAAAQFQTPGTQLTSEGRLGVSRIPRLVLAHYYPWYTVDTWHDPQMADKPSRLYSTDDQTDVDEQARRARAVGIDSFVVSWQGKEADNGFNARRMRIVLEAARRAGLTACVYTETLVANVGNNFRLPADPQVMFEWLADIIDNYGSHPAFLRIDGRPVIFIYAASRLSQPQWIDIVARLRSSGRIPLLLGDFIQSPLLETFDGEYQYSHVQASASDLLEIDRAESIRVRTHGLLRPQDRRRIWMATVSPGYDDRRLRDRDTPFEIPRAGGRVYDDQWTAAVDTAADWVVITSWNEWWENTEIESSERYGATFLDRTREWTRRFKQ